MCRRVVELAASIRGMRAIPSAALMLVTGAGCVPAGAAGVGAVVGPTGRLIAVPPGGWRQRHLRATAVRCLLLVLLAITAHGGTAGA